MEDAGTREYHVNGGERSDSRDAARCSRRCSCLVTFRDRRCDDDDAKFDSFPLLYISGNVYASWEKSMQPRTAYRSREHSCLVAFRDGCFDNDDRLMATYRSHALRNICLYGSVSGSRGVARCSRGRSYLVALRDGCCDNDNATSESITLSYTGSLCGICNVGALW